MPQRIIDITINKDGTIKVDNSQNADPERILKELGQLSEIANGDPAAFKVEKHVHTHGHAHEHGHDDAHVHG